MPSDEIEVLHALAAALEQAQAGAIKELRHQFGSALHGIDEGTDLLPCENGRKAGGSLGTDDVVEPGQVDVEHFAIEE